MTTIPNQVEETSCKLHDHINSPSAVFTDINQDREPNPNLPWNLNLGSLGSVPKYIHSCKQTTARPGWEGGTGEIRFFVTPKGQCTIWIVP